ncbi:sodium channel protein Nach-like [Rhynchophorus ferrugineus]|uniref:sodium channel protein Nach-like n=1 Tax=Rhynchophorus ferrugineus TaxID=354439 RepID=UPI003FCED87F
MSAKLIMEKLKVQWVQFCLNTSLHGWKFCVLSPTKLGRIFWLTICFAALVTALSLLLAAWYIFQEMPVVTVAESTQHFIYNYPFPAVTICNYNKVSKQAAFTLGAKLASKTNISTEQAAESFKSLIHTLNHHHHNVDKEKANILEELLRLNNKTIDEVFLAISPSCSSLLKRCLWKGDERRCNIMFSQIKTANGYCCSFNYVQPKDKAKHYVTPKRTSSTGLQSALEVLIDSNQDDYFAAEIPSIGYRVLIHGTYNFPSADTDNIFCARRSNALIGITPTTTVASSGLRRIPLDQRNCLFSDERHLTYFHIQNFHNCVVENKLKFIYRICGCMPFYAPKIEEKVRLCTPMDASCVANHEDIMEKRDEAVQNLNCVEDCESTFYKASTYQGTLEARYTTRFNTYNATSIENFTVIRVYFEDLYQELYRREIIFTWYTILAYYGGIMGLFTGFSFISLVEIVYFFTIKLCAPVRVKPVTLCQVQPQNNFKGQRNKTKIIKHINKY